MELFGKSERFSTFINMISSAYGYIGSKYTFDVSVVKIWFLAWTIELKVCKNCLFTLYVFHIKTC